jgi:hypothetical protein
MMPGRESSRDDVIFYKKSLVLTRPQTGRETLIKKKKTNCRSVNYTSSAKDYNAAVSN